MRGRLVPAVFVATAAAASLPAIARGDVDGAALLRMMGPHAKEAFAARGAPGIGALVRLPAGVRAADVGLGEAAPGIGRIYGSPAKLLSFADAHPSLDLEVGPPLRLLLDSAGRYVGSAQATLEGLDGTGAIVGVADTGIDVTHKDFIDAAGHTRIAWLLDLSSPPRGKWPQLEQQFGTVDDNGHVVSGAVWDADDINALLSGQRGGLPKDEVGHGTLVASCAAGNGELGRSVYRGIAPKATIVAARIASAGSEDISNDDLLRGVAFLYDRADNAVHAPIVVNLSIGSDFGPHDGTMAWEETLASYVGSSHPGHAIVAAAGNSGSIADTPVHQNVHVSQASTTRVPLLVEGVTTGGVEVWISMHQGASFQVGLEAPDGSTWIAPVSPNQQGAKNTSDYNAGIYNGSGSSGSPVPSSSRGAVIVWQGQWPSGTYQITLTGGEGTADLYAVGTGNAASASAVGFAYGVRESTINLPATNPAIIGVGCTINKWTWVSVSSLKVGLAVPVLDATGGLADLQAQPRDPVPGEPCWFSSAGPTLTGVAKPEIMAPGAAIIGALSAQAVPPASASIFTNPQCPTPPGKKPNELCQQIDATHGVSFGTSFSSPIVAGAVAVLLQHDPTLTQDEVLAALQGGAHPLRGAAPFEDQAGPGEVDVLGAVRAADRNRTPQTALPSRSTSWLTLGADLYLADSSTQLQGVVELRTAPDASGTPEPADGIGAGRLASYALVDGETIDGTIQSLARRGPGVWIVTTQLPPGLGGSQLTVGVTLDGQDVVTPKTIPIAADTWDADYSGWVKGGCAVSATRAGGSLAWWAAALGVAIVLGARRVSGPSAEAGATRAKARPRATSPRCGRARA